MAEAEAGYDLRALNNRGRGRGLSTALIAVAIDERGSLAERMANAYPWMLALGQADRERCARDLVDAARASFATGQAHPIKAALTSWRETASALAAGMRNSPVDWLDDEIFVTRP